MNKQDYNAYVPVNKGISKIKPDFDMAAKRWEAYWNHDVLDRPLLRATLPKPGAELLPVSTYKERIEGDLDFILKKALQNAENTLYLGEEIPGFWTSLSSHEIAAYCGYELVWADNGHDTNWCKHSDKELDELLPLKIDKDGFMWKRYMELVEKFTDFFQGRVLPNSIDFHSNLDLLISIRGDANLCIDTLDNPEGVDRGVENACELFKQMWEAFDKASGSGKYGYQFDCYSDKPTTSLACDFSALISEDMFRRWGVPALEYESSVIGERSIYHWDGPDALKHCDALLGIKNLHTFSYVPSPFTYHYQFIEIYQKCQKHGKGIFFEGTPEEIKAAHKQLDPSLTVYRTHVDSEEEFLELEDWLRKHM